MTEKVLRGNQVDGFFAKDQCLEQKKSHQVFELAD